MNETGLLGVHLSIGVIHVLAGVIGSFIALKTLNTMAKRPEMFEIQRKFWLPILIGALFFSVGGVFHLLEHFVHGVMMAFLHDLVDVLAVFWITLGIFRYSQLPIFKIK